MEPANQMLDNRLVLDVMLKSITSNVYFQPPESMKMRYPCIKYSRTTIENLHANDDVYSQSHKYEIVVIDEDPDSYLVNKVSQLPKCRYDRHYTADNFNHDVFTLYF